MDEQKSTDKTSFLRGLIVGIAVIVVLGGVFLAGKQFSTGQSTTKKTIATTPTSPTPTTPTAEIRMADVSDEDWVKGDPEAPITIVEFSDLECPFCKRFHATMQQLITEYDGQVNWVYRHFPLATLHKKAEREAQATECAGEQGGNDGFWAYTDRLFEITPSNDGLQDSQLPQIAEDIGLNVSEFQECLDSGKFAQKIQNQYTQAVAAGGRGTPHSIVVTPDGEFIPVSGAVPYEQLKAVIDSIL